MAGQPLMEVLIDAVLVADDIQEGYKPRIPKKIHRLESITPGENLKQAQIFNKSRGFSNFKRYRDSSLVCIIKIERMSRQLKELAPKKAARAVADKEATVEDEIIETERITKMHVVKRPLPERVCIVYFFMMGLPVNIVYWIIKEMMRVRDCKVESLSYGNTLTTYLMSVNSDLAHPLDRVLDPLDRTIDIFIVLAQGQSVKHNLTPT
ncbi:hypothetical protein RND71_009687 [Anisodus tanguticus]|uniref:Uncharacterized protein n=1 Tax=Anisodus tanguticus TaxID=243964 RepID=A0AAE1SI80_9SOLA|nr:hypothetical protein RND71_009687 [Anisodus tanguticus]